MLRVSGVSILLGAIVLNTAAIDLVAPKLSVETESSFSGTSGTKSAFWSSSGFTGSIVMTRENACHPQRCVFSSSEDARVVIKAAWGEEGLYLLADVTDDSWSLPTAGMPFERDVVTFFLDSMSSSEIVANVSAHVNPAYGWDLTMTSISLGASFVENGVRFDCYSRSFWDWTFSTYRTDSLPARLDGLVFKKVASAGEGFIEMRIPWSLLNRITLPAAGARLAFTGTYADRDANQDSVGVLAWLQATPYDTAAGVISWGDLLLSSDILAVNPRTVQHLARSTAAEVADNRRYDLRGRAINANSSSVSSCINLRVNTLGVAVLTVR